MSKNEERVGQEFVTKQGYLVKIIEYPHCLNCTVEFDDNNSTTLRGIAYDRLKNGSLVNPNHPNKYNGFIGLGKFKSSYNRIPSHAYTVWSDILKRVYSEKYHENKPTYKEVSLCKEWHSFQIFAEWFEVNYNAEIMKGWKIDKDIICGDCKIYSPWTCAFVPNEINGMFISSKSYRGDLPIGVIKHNGHYEAYYRDKFLGYSNDDPLSLFPLYKKAKEDYIKEVADKWKDKIDPRVYQAMYNYQVEITD